MSKNKNQFYFYFFFLGITLPEFLKILYIISKANLVLKNLTYHPVWIVNMNAVFGAFPPQEPLDQTGTNPKVKSKVNCGYCHAKDCHYTVACPQREAEAVEA